MTDQQPTNPYEVTQAPGAAPARRFPWISTIFFVFSFGVSYLVGIAIGQMHGISALTPAFFGMAVFRAAIELFVPTAVLAVVMRLIFFRTTFKPWFYFFLMVFNIIVGGVFLACAPYFLLKELGIVE